MVIKIIKTQNKVGQPQNSECDYINNNNIVYVNVTAKNKEMFSFP